MFEYLQFENPEVLTFVVALIGFVFSYFVLIRVLKDRNKGIVILISVVIAFIIGWNLYKNRFYDMENVLSFFLVVVVLGVFLKIGWAFFKKFRRGF